MRNRSNIKIFVLFALILFLSVGYAVVSSVSLSITGTVAAGSTDLKVSFNGTKTVSNLSKGSASVTAGSKTATFTASNLTLNESITYTYTVQNTETDVAANVSLSVSGNNEYFTATVSPTSISIQPSATTIVTVVVKMIKTPVNSANSSAEFTVTLNAAPSEPKDLINFKVDSVVYTAESNMTWGEWINSSYNNSPTGTFTIKDNVVFVSELYLFTSSAVRSNDLIISGYNYYSSLCCFDPGSKVLMADGTYKNIEDVKVGDMVMSLNEETGEYVAQRVQATIIKENSDDLVYVHLSNGLRIGMRAYHPLLTIDGWKSLRPEMAETLMDVGEVPMLKIGDVLVGIDGNPTIVSIESRADIENYTTYNLSVENTHNYIVEGVVVHNASCAS